MPSQERAGEESRVVPTEGSSLNPNGLHERRAGAKQEGTCGVVCYGMKERPGQGGIQRQPELGPRRQDCTNPAMGSGETGKVSPL